MRTMGLSLGLLLLCLLRVQAEERGAGELDKIAGTWYITAMASDSESYLQKKDQLKMAMANIDVLENGDLRVSFAIPTPGLCMKFESTYMPTDKPREYYSTDRGTKKTVRLVDTDGRSYMVLFATREKDGKTLRMLRLYSRTQYVRPKINLLFKKLAKMNGFTNETIWMLPRQEECRLDEP